MFSILQPQHQYGDRDNIAIIARQIVVKTLQFASPDISSKES
jgi:hypothetical protein